jgi:RNase adaptor protein for sRNA GlmZ degradation
MCDCGVVDKECKNPNWKTPKKTIKQHLDYKFIMALEGNDVASNLKWVMSSNSIAVMPRPTCETWFMEGKLIPNYHYIEIKDDLSDLEERLNYYISHPEEAQQIIDHAHEYVQQFMDEEREEIIQILVMDKYLSMIK